MTWLSDYSDIGAARGQARKALGLPIGLASPLWLTFGAAASAGVAWWWMTRWTKALNIEAMAVAAPAAPLATEPATAEAAPAPVALELVEEPAAEIAAPEETVIAVPAPAEPVAESDDAETVMEAVADAADHVVEAVSKVADDLTVLVGIGPKLAEALAARGVTRYAQLAAWSAEETAEVDRALSLKGRATRDNWVSQARRLAKKQA